MLSCGFPFMGAAHTRTCNIENVQCDITGFVQDKPDLRPGVEWIGIILKQTAASDSPAGFPDDALVLFTHQLIFRAVSFIVIVPFRSQRKVYFTVILEYLGIE